MAWIKDGSSTAPIDVHASSGVFTYDDDGNCLCKSENGSSCTASTNVFAKIKLGNDSSNFDNIEDYPEVSMACSSISCNQDMFTVWYKNTSRNNVLNDSSMFEIKNEDECSYIVIANTSGTIKTGSQDFDKDSYTDSGYPKISTCPCCKSGISWKYVAGVSYSGHKIKYLPFADKHTISSNEFSTNTDVVELYFPVNAKGISGDSRNITEIGSNAFIGLTSLSAVTFGGVERIGDRAFSGLTKLELVDFSSACNSSSSKVKYIGDGAFAQCIGIKELCLHKLTNLESIGSGAFATCTSLSALTLPTSSKYTTINGLVFLGCTSLHIDLEIPNNIKTIGTLAFGNHNLISVKIPKSVKSIENGAFNTNQSSGTIFYLNWNSSTELDDVSFGPNCFGTAGTSCRKIYVPRGLVDYYTQKLTDYTEVIEAAP